MSKALLEYVTPTRDQTQTFKLTAALDIQAIQELEHLIQQHYCVVDQLSDLERAEFVNYAEEVARRRAECKWKTLQMDAHSIQPSLAFPHKPERYIENLSSVPLDKTVLEVRSLGPQFCCLPRRTNRLNIEVQFENLCSQT